VDESEVFDCVWDTTVTGKLMLEEDTEFVVS